MEWNETLHLYRQLVDTRPEFDLKGKNMIYTSANGYMFSHLNKEGQLGIRLPKERAMEFLHHYESGPFLSYGAVMKDYVLVPEHLLTEGVDELSQWLLESFEYVLTLPPK